MNTERLFSGKTDEELSEEARGLYGAIFVMDSFSASDRTRYELLCQELERRGYIVYEDGGFSVGREEDEC